MFRIDNASAAVAMPTPQPPGPGGYFTKGDPTTSQPATIVEADFLNIVQEELCNIVAKGGQTLNKSDNTQLLKALSALFTGSWTNVTATQNILVPPWATQIAFRLVGSGGGGGHCQATTANDNYLAGAGGGSGGYAEAQRPVTPGIQLQVVLGTGGASETGGGLTSIASVPNNWTVTCSGGNPAVWTGPNNCAGGAGGSASGGDLNCAGTFGGDGEAAGVPASTGYGGPGPWGGGPRAAVPNTSYPHAPDGQGPGAGGAGAYDYQLKTGNYYAGGAGANGLLQYRFLP